MTLFVCGDSYSSIVIDQPPLSSWSELLAKKLNTDLENYSRPAASNSIISMQIDHAIKNIKNNDIVVIFLTDHFRLVEVSGSINPNISLFEQIVNHKNQKSFLRSNNQIISSGTLMNPTSVLMSEVFLKMYDPLLQYYIDKEMMFGTLTRLKEKTKNLLVISGGWGRSLPINVNASIDLQLLQNNFLNYDVKFLNGLNESDSPYINHLTNLAHLKLSSSIYQYLRDNFIIN